MSNKLQKTNSNLGKKTGLGLASVNMKGLTESLNNLLVPRLFYQLVVFVLDGSGSMTYPGMTGKSKGTEIEESVKQVIKRLLNSKNKNSFDISVWAYANESVQILPKTTVSSFDLEKSLNPCDYIEKYNKTDLTSTIKSVQLECDNYLEQNKDKNAQALVLVLSDGAIHNYNDTVKLFDNLKSNSKITIASIFYESKEWQEEYSLDVNVLKGNMKILASNSELFTSSLDPEEIRKHMIKSISTVSKID